MTKQDQIKALAELDGWTKHKHYDFDYPVWIPKGFNYDSDSSKGIYASPYNLIKLEHELPKWTSSYDAIILLIQKQSEQVQDDIGTVMCKMDAFRNKWFWQATPSQLSEALLRATNKWKE